MGVLANFLVTTMMVATVLTACCDKNLLQDLYFKISGFNLLFPCSSTKDIYITSGRWIPRNIIATKIQFNDEEAIVTLPKFLHGVPYSLAKFSLKPGINKVQLEPFPCWRIHEEGNCDAIQNAIDIVKDPFERIWVLDLGVCNTLDQPVRRCSPKIWGLSMKTGEVIKTVNLEAITNNESRLQSIIVECDANGGLYAYIPDAKFRAIIVVNLISGSMYRVILPEIVSDACSIKDTLYLQIAYKPTGNELYFTYQSSSNLFSIKTKYLRTGQTSGAIVDVGPKPEGTKIVLLGNDNGSIIFFRYSNEFDVYIWNSNTCFKKENFVLVQKGGDCRIPTAIVGGWKGLIWAIESNFQHFISNSTGCLGANIVVYPLVKTDD